jgi:hypothetical protein
VGATALIGGGGQALAQYYPPHLAYVGGDTIKVTISGGDVLTLITQGQVGPLMIPIIAAGAFQQHP